MRWGNRFSALRQRPPGMGDTVGGTRCSTSRQPTCSDSKWMWSLSETMTIPTGMGKDSSRFESLISRLRKIAKRVIHWYGIQKSLDINILKRKQNNWLGYETSQAWKVNDIKARRKKHFFLMRTLWDLFFFCYVNYFLIVLLNDCSQNIPYLIYDNVGKMIAFESVFLVDIIFNFFRPSYEPRDLSSISDETFAYQSSSSKRFYLL